MSEKPTQAVAVKRDVRDLLNSDKVKLEIARVLPKHVTPERMTRVALTSILKTPDLLNCTPESLLNALLVCAQAGLEPDGRLAHLIPFGTTVQVIFDWKGLVALALRNGYESVWADKVCDGDQFSAEVKDGQKVICHAVDWMSAAKRGEVRCYYALCRRGGVVDFEIMSKDEVESIKKRSRAGKSGPWVTDFDEMGKKTVLRRLSKRWDLLPEIRDVINADDDTPPPLDTVKITKPIFTALPESQPPPIGHPAQPQVDKISELCKKDGIKIDQVVDFMISSGLADSGQSTLTEIHMSNPAALDAIIEQWEDVSRRIKENAND